MSNWPLAPSTRMETAGIVSASSMGTTITNPGTANTKSSWVELTAATGFSYDLIVVAVNQTASTDTIFDIAIGAAGSEQVIVENVLLKVLSTLIGYLVLPIHVPAGVRIAARAQYESTIQSNDIAIIGIAGGAAFPPGYRKAVGLGVDLTNTGGVAVSSGSSANSKGAWGQIKASTAEDYAAITLMQALDGESGAGGTARVLMDIGIGASGSEKVVVPDVTLSFDSSNYMRPRPSVFPASIPAGSRLAVRWQKSVAGAGSLDWGLLGLAA